MFWEYNTSEKIRVRKEDKKARNNAKLHQCKQLNLPNFLPVTTLSQETSTTQG